jgi:hypothetical protein
MYHNQPMTNPALLLTTISAALATAPAAAAPPVHVQRTGRVAVATSAELAFDLFTPLGERRWAPGWEPRFHHPADGAPRVGATFTTRGEDGRETIWMILDWVPAARRVRYARVTPGLKTGTVEVALAPAPGGSTVATVTYDLVALSPEGAADLATWTESWYAGYLREWEEQIAAALGSRREPAAP